MQLPGICLARMQSYLDQVCPQGLKKPADAVHLATAILHNCDELHTTDGENLLQLNGRIARLDRTPLVICRPPDPPPPPPEPPQRDLFTQAQEDANAASERSPQDQDNGATEEGGSAVRTSGEGTGMPGGRGGIRDGAEADSGSGGGAEASTEEAREETDLTDQAEGDERVE